MPATMPMSNTNTAETPSISVLMDVHEKGWSAHDVSKVFGVSLKDAFDGMRLAKQKLIDAKRSRLRVPTWGHDGVLAAYGAQGMESISRRRSKVKCANRFPYQQSPVGPV